MVMQHRPTRVPTTQAIGVHLSYDISCDNSSVYYYISNIPAIIYTANTQFFSYVKLLI